MNFIHSIIDPLRDKYAPVTHTSTFRSTGQITPEEFVNAGDFLVYKFPSWSWSDAPDPGRRVAYLPDGKQFLVTRGVPCHRRLDENFAGEAGTEETIVKDELPSSDGSDNDDGWLRTGGGNQRETADIGDVRPLEGSKIIGEKDEEEDIPDMEDEDDDEEAIIRDPKQGGTKAPLRTYTLYITYTPYYRTPRLYLSGYQSPSEPLPPKAMLEDIAGDHREKTVTLEDFPFFDPIKSVKMASVHPCRHASVMKVLLDRADAALKLRRQRMKQEDAISASRKADIGMEGLVDDTRNLDLSDRAGHKAGVAAAGGNGGDEWEVLQHEGNDEEETAIRVDQYLVVFLKFQASVTPGIEHDQTMGI